MTNNLAELEAMSQPTVSDSGLNTISTSNESLNVVIPVIDSSDVNNLVPENQINITNLVETNNILLTILKKCLLYKNNDKLISLFNLIICIYLLIHQYNPEYNYIEILKYILYINLSFYKVILLKYSKNVIGSIANYNTHDYKYLKYIKLVQIMMYVTIIILMSMMNIQINLLIYPILGIVIDFIYHGGLCYYLAFKCTNLEILSLYGCINIIDLKIENYTLLEDNEFNLEIHDHICEENCNSCPCGICHEKITKASKLKCGHEFCYLCIFKTVSYNKANNKKLACPYCRADII